MTDREPITRESLDRMHTEYRAAQAASSNRVAQWCIDLDASWYGWHIDGDGYAHKEGLKITKHLLRDLVSELGWRGAERRAIEVERGRVIPNSVAEVCGAPNPYGTSNCGQPRGHEGDHRPADAAPNSVRAYDGQGCARCGFPIHADDTSEEQDMSPAPPIRRHRDCLEAAYQAGRRNA